MALESLPKIAPALFSAEQDLIEIYNKKSDTRGTINPSYIKSSPSGVSGAIQFSDGSAFASDASNLFWDDTNNRLGVGTNAPVNIFQVKTTQANANGSIAFGNQTSATILAITDTGSALTQLQFRASSYNFTDCAGMRIASSGYSNVASAMLQVVGSGSTSATTSLLVQNSAGTAALTVKDDLSSTFGGNINGGNINATANIQFQTTLYGNNFFSQNTGKTTIGEQAAAHASAMLDVRSTTMGFLMPRMTTAEINAIASPANGLQAYNTTLACPCFYDGIAWRKVSHTTM